MVRQFNWDEFRMNLPPLEISRENVALVVCTHLYNAGIIEYGEIQPTFRGELTKSDFDLVRDLLESSILLNEIISNEPCFKPRNNTPN